VAIALIWELFSRRALLSEIISATRLVEDIETTRLIGISAKWHNQIDWATMLAKTDTLDILFMYGRTWRNTNREALCNFANRSKTIATIILPDPDDQHLVKELSHRLSTSSQSVTPEEAATRIREAINDFVTIFNIDGKANEKLTIWCVPISPVYSYYKLDNISIIALYKHDRKIEEVPTLIVEKGGTLFNYYQEDFLTLISGPDPLGKKVFPSP
jgi:hypothetical protein